MKRMLSVLLVASMAAVTFTGAALAEPSGKPAPVKKGSASTSDLPAPACPDNMAWNGSSCVKRDGIVVYDAAPSTPPANAKKAVSPKQSK
jgi:hypothetical protein